MNILVLTGYDDAFVEIGDVTTPGKAAYADRWGFAFECVRDYPTHYHPSWHKLQMLKDRISYYDAIVWLDADSVITNADINVMDMPGKTILTASQDWCAPADERPEDAKGINFGNFILKNTPDAQLWIAMAAQHTQFAARSTCCWEQDAVLKCMREDPWFNSQVTRLPRRALNAVHSECKLPSITAPDPWQPGDFLIHLTNVPDRAAKARYYASL
jgi:hypothetical protein